MDKLPKTLGFGMGLEFRESSLLLSSKSQSKAKPGMVFNVSIGKKPACILTAPLVSRITEAGSPVSCVSRAVFFARAVSGVYCDF